MKILLLNQTYHPDGAATAQQLTELARFLSSRGHHVTVIAERREYESRRLVFAERETIDGVDIHRVLSTAFGKRSFFHRMIDGFTYEIAAAWRMLQLPRQDVVISFTSPPLLGLLGALYGRVSGCATVQWLMDVNPDAAIAVGYLKPDAALTRFLVRLFEMSLQHSTRVVVLDRWMRERAVARGASRESIAIVPPWPVHKSDAASAEDALAFRREAGLVGKHVVLFSGNHSIVHPLDTLLEAAFRLRDDDSIRFVFIGGGLRVGDVTAFRERHNLKNIIQLAHQPKEKLPATLACGDIHAVVMGNAVTGLVHTSKLYGVLATGAPYVFLGPKQSHGADLIAEHPYGYHVEHGEVDRLVTVIRQAQELSPERRREFAEKNTGLLQNRYRAELSLLRFEEEVIRPLEAAKEIVPAVVRKVAS